VVIDKRHIMYTFKRTERNLRVIYHTKPDRKYYLPCELYRGRWNDHQECEYLRCRSSNSNSCTDTRANSYAYTNTHPNSGRG
jgi:hypothetical protein